MALFNLYTVVCYYYYHYYFMALSVKNHGLNESLKSKAKLEQLEVQLALGYIKCLLDQHGIETLDYD